MYRRTKHNLGGWVIEKICDGFDLRLRPGKGHYYYAEKDGLLLVRPTTFVNNSGIAVYDLLLDFSLSLEEILIVLDDIDLPFGKLRIRGGGSSGGHKGLTSVIYHCDSEEIPRLRIGIGRPECVDEVDWVLSPFPRGEEEKLTEVIEKARNAIFLWVNEDIKTAMSRIN